MTSDTEELLSSKLLPWVNEKEVPSASLCGRDPSTFNHFTTQALVTMPASLS